MSEKFNPRVEVHNGEGLTITLRPDEKQFSTLDKKESEIVLSFNDEDVGDMNEVKLKNNPIGKEELVNEVFMGQRPPVITYPIDGYSDWDGVIRYNLNFDEKWIDSSELRVEISSTGNFSSPEYTEIVDLRTREHACSFSNLASRFGLGGRVYIRMVLRIPNDVLFFSSISCATIYNSFRVNILTPLNMSNQWDGTLTYEVNRLNSIRDIQLVAEVSLDQDFTDVYTETISENGSATLNLNRMLSKFGSNSTVFIRLRYKFSNVYVNSNVVECSLYGVIISLLHPSNMSTDWDTVVRYTSNENSIIGNVITSYEIQISKNIDFSTIDVKQVTDSNTKEYNFGNVKITQDLGRLNTVFIRVKSVVGNTDVYSNVIQTVTNGYIRVRDKEHLIQLCNNDPDISMLDTIDVRDMSYFWCQINSNRRNSDLVRIMNSWDMSNVTSMKCMFGYPDSSYSGTNVFHILGYSDFNSPFPSINTNNVTDMSYMFHGCKMFDSSVSNLNTNNVTDMSYMFASTVKSIDYMDNAVIEPKPEGVKAYIDNLRTPQIQQYSQNKMPFNQPLNHFNTSKVTNMEGMFIGCTLFNQPLNNWNTSKVTNMSSMFRGCSVFNGNIVDWDTSKVTDFSYMFSSIMSPYTLYYDDNYSSYKLSFNQSVSDWNVSSATNVEGMFMGCSELSISLERWNFTNITNFKAFLMYTNSCTISNSLNTTNVTNISYMFCKSSFNQDISNWDVSNVTDMSFCFADNRSFNQDIANWNTSKVVSFKGIFSNSVFNYDINGWSQDSAEDMSFMFSGKYNFSNLYNGSSFPLKGYSSYSFFQDFKVTGTKVKNVAWLLPNIMLGAFEISTDILNSSLASTLENIEGLLSNVSNVNLININYSFTNLKNVAYLYANFTLFGASNVNWTQDQVNSMLKTFNSVTNFHCTYYRIFTNGSSTYSFDISGISLSSAKSTSCMFANNGINFLNSFKSKVSSRCYDISSMFLGTDFNQDISNWDVSNVTDMSNLFKDCKKFNQPLNSWNVSKVTNMKNIFRSSCFNKPLNLWNVSNVTNMSYMFASTEFNQDISNWDVSNVTDMSYMFYDTPFNQPLNSWNVGKVTNMEGIFSGVYVIPSKSGNYVKRSNMFNQPLNSWNVSKVTNMSKMFQYNFSFNQNISNWDVSNVTNMSWMFNGCIPNIETVVDGSWWLTGFIGGGVAHNFNQDISNWDVSNVTNMKGMFEMSNFNQDISSWNTVNVKNMANMFRCNRVYNKNLNTLNTSNVTDMSYMFQGASAFNLDLNNWDTGSCLKMDSMFSKFYIDIKNIQGQVSKSVTYNVIFNRNISMWNVNNVTSSTSMFDSCPISSSYKPRKSDGTVLG